MGNFPSVGPTGLTQIFQNAEDFLDNKTMKITDLDLGRVAAKASDKGIKNPNIPISSDKLIRYNFLEVCIRLAQ